MAFTTFFQVIQSKDYKLIYFKLCFIDEIINFLGPELLFFQRNYFTLHFYWL
jgi:hypothetical protein